MFKICRNTCHTFKELNVYESLITDLGLDGVSSDESIAGVEHNDASLSANRHVPMPYREDQGPIVYEGFSTTPPRCKRVLHTRIIDLPFRSAAVNTIIWKIDEQYSQWIKGLEELGKTAGPFRQRDVTAVLEDTHCYKRGLPIDFYSVDWLEGLMPRMWMDLQIVMKLHWLVTEQ